MRLKLPTLLCLVAAIILAGCESGGPTTSDKDIQRVDYNQVEELLKNPSAKKPTVLVDLRSADAYAKGHLPGAIHIPLGELKARDERLAGADKVILYHEDIKGDFPDIAVKILMSAGLHSAYSYRGGYQDWNSRKSGGTPEEMK
jgi:rhodanese-related sulfurtransferase